MRGENKTSQSEGAKHENVVQSFAPKIFQKQLNFFSNAEKRFTQQHKAIQEILRLSYETPIFLDGISESIVVFKHDGEISYWNSYAESEYGWSREEVLGKNIEELMFTETQKDTLKVAFNHFSKYGAWSGEIKNKTKSGDQIEMISKWSQFNLPSVPRILMINTNITDKKIIENQFYKIQRMQNIGSLASGIAHDLNNIISSFIMALKLIKPKLKDKEGKSVLALLEESTYRGINLVGQILNFSKGLEAEKQVFDISLIVHEVKQFMAETFPKDIKINVEANIEDYHAFANPTQVYQILLNLCMNAKDALERGGSISISLNKLRLTGKDKFCLYDEIKPGDYIQVQVKDDGEGIKRSLLKKIFTPYFTTKEKGTGLGLFTVKSIVDNHKGYIDCKTAQNKGTCFDVYFLNRDNLK